jgi:hypothetical protein
VSSSWLRVVLRALFVVVLGGAAVTFRVLYAGERAIAASTAALEAGDPNAAIDEARAAATWYAPGAPHVRVAYGRLMALGKEAEARHQKDVALRAYRAVTTASASTTWARTPHAEDAQHAREAIARLEATSDRPIGSATEPASVIEAKLLAEMAREPGPERTWTVVLAASFAAVLVGIGLVLGRALDETGRLHAKPAWVGGVLAAVGVAGYALALWLA